LLGFSFTETHYPPNTRIPLFLREQVSVPPVQTGGFVASHPTRVAEYSKVVYIICGSGICWVFVYGITLSPEHTDPLFLREQVSVPPVQTGGFVASQPESRNTRRCCLHHLRVGDLLGFSFTEAHYPPNTRIPLFLREQVSVTPRASGVGS